MTTIIRSPLEEATAHHEAGRMHQAEVLYRQILQAHPANADALHGLGLLASAAGQRSDAITLLSRAVQHRPGSAVFRNSLGEAFRLAGRYEEALICYRRALELVPSYTQAQVNLGGALREAGQKEAAIEALQQAIQSDPQEPRAYYHLGNTLDDLNRLPEAIQAYYSATDLQPQYAEAWNNLGCALSNLDRIDEAITAYHQAATLRPDWLGTRLNLAINLQLCGDSSAALAEVEAVLQAHPEHAAAHWNRALLLLGQGDLGAGWREYEWRFACQNGRRPEPAWDGSDPRGLTIAVHAEQGFGDTIQFARYLPLLADRGARVVLTCQGPLQALLQRSFPSAQVIRREEPLPPVDRHIALMSLPLVFGTTLATIPTTVRYLQPDPPQVKRWAERLGQDGPGRRIGLVWAGRPTHPNDRRRSLHLELLSPLAAIPDVCFYSLQLGEAARQVAHPPAGLHLIDYTGELEDFDATAALIANLDLVIAADTGVAHLAGALGKPVLLLLPYVADWRWLLGREDTPWYPTLRLYRQRHLGDWTEPIEHVAQDVRGIY